MRVRYRPSFTICLISDVTVKALFMPCASMTPVRAVRPERRNGRGNERTMMKKHREYSTGNAHVVRQAEGGR